MRVIARTVLLMFIMSILLSFVTCVGVLAGNNPPPIITGDGQGTPAPAQTPTSTPAPTTPVTGGTGVSPQNSISSTTADIGQAEVGINKLAATILKYMQLIGSIVAVVILAVYGVQWFLASPQQKAILKEKAWGYLIGAALVFGGATIMGWLGETFSKAIQ